MLKFDDVVKCKDIAELNLFIAQYLAERNIVASSERAKRTYWALLYRWKEGFSVVKKQAVSTRAHV